MAQVAELSTPEKDFLKPYLPLKGSGLTSGDGTATDGAGTLPFVTLTYASSLDGMISLAPGLRTTLSGPETKSMTHYLRLHHDAILVGVGTAVPDDPALNCRYPGVSLSSQPRPVIIDPKGRWNVGGSKVAELARLNFLYAADLLPSQTDLSGLSGEYIGLPTAEIAEGRSNPGRRSADIPWLSILKALKSKGIESVMIEGGATIISTLLCMPELVDSVIVTLAPTWLGEGGVAVRPKSTMVDEQRTNAATLKQTSWRQFGSDAVLCGRLRT